MTLPSSIEGKIIGVGGAIPVASLNGLLADTPVAYRTAVVAPDVAAVPGTVTCTKLTGVGSLLAATYNVKVVAGNVYGRTTAKAGNAAVTTETTNLGVRAAFAAVPNATYYDIYCSTDGDPKWVGRITETQRGTGIKLTAVATTGAGGIAGAVDIYAVGTGLQAATTAAVNTAYVHPATVDCSGHQYVSFNITASRTGDAALLACVVVPFYLDDLTSTYMVGAPVTLTFGGVAGVYTSLCQRLQIEARGNAAVGLLVESISGTGASLDITSELS